MITEYNVKLAFRFLLLLFVCYIVYTVTSIEYVNSFHNKEFVLSTIVTAVFGTLTLIVNFHFRENISK